MRLSRDTEPILPTTNMATTNGKSKDGKKKVLVVGAGAAGMVMFLLSSIMQMLTW
jgi:threonine dehydrogenase-like Zn-dependent dehydrogenase